MVAGSWSICRARKAGRVEAIRQRPGNRGFLVVANGNTGECVAIALWQDAVAAATSQALFRDHIEAFRPLLSGAPTVVAGEVHGNALPLAGTA